MSTRDETFLLQSRCQMSRRTLLGGLAAAPLGLAASRAVAQGSGPIRIGEWRVEIHVASGSCLLLKVVVVER